MHALSITVVTETSGRIALFSSAFGGSTPTFGEIKNLYFKNCLYYMGYSTKNTFNTQK